MSSQFLQTLEKAWGELGATYGDLDDDSGNILDLIEKSYNVCNAYSLFKTLV